MEQKARFQKFVDSYYSDNKQKLIKDCVEALSCCVGQAQEKQQQGIKGDVHLICFSFLISGIPMGRYQLQIDLFDQRMFLDQASCTAYFSYDFIKEAYEELVAENVELVKSKLIRFKPYEKDFLQLGLNYILFEQMRSITETLFFEQALLEFLYDSPLTHLREISYGYLFNQQETIFSYYPGE